MRALLLLMLMLAVALVALGAVEPTLFVLSLVGLLLLAGTAAAAVVSMQGPGPRPHH